MFDLSIFYILILGSPLPILQTSTKMCDRPKPRTSEKVSKLQIKITALFHKIGIDLQNMNVFQSLLNYFEILNEFLPKNATTKGL